MEGVLWKWTNYWNGWQPRWFILENGVLSYFKSQEEVNQGCKGSIKMSVCDIIAHATDNNRLDLVIPGEQHFYLKAASPKERQQWLVSLGTTKACIRGRHRAHSESSPDILKSKKSELRLYCDLLMQQIHSVKESVNKEGSFDAEKLSEASDLLSATCDTFSRTLEECMKLASDADPTMSQPPIPSNKLARSSPLHRSNSLDRSSHHEPLKELPQTHSLTPDKLKALLSYFAASQSLDEVTMEDSAKAKTKGDNFFTNLDTKFTEINIVKGIIPAQQFLDACRSIITICDILGHTTFGPVKMDVLGNIKKIEAKLSEDKDKFGSLQDIVLDEINTNTVEKVNSATDALLWLRRGMEFIRQFLLEFAKGSDEVSSCTRLAYEKVLSPHHNILIRGLFKVAISTLPSRDTVVKSLSSLSVESLMDACGETSAAMTEVLAILNDFHEKHGLPYIVD